MELQQLYYEYAKEMYANSRKFITDDETYKDIWFTYLLFDFQSSIIS